MNEQIESVPLLPGELKRRFLKPLKSVTFYKHLIVSVIVFGGLGVCVAIWRSHWSMVATSEALLCYFPALAGAAMLEFDAEDEPYLRSFGIIALLVFIVLLVLGFASSPTLQFCCSLLGTGLSILFWWVANGPNKHFDDVLKAKNALGGDTSGGLQKSSQEGWLQ